MADQGISNYGEETMRIPKHIPEDILLNILPRLPVKSLLRFRSVCRLWKYIIDDHSFIDIHSAHAHSRIVFSFYKQGATHLYSANLEGGPAAPLLNLPGYTQQDIAKASFHVLDSLNGLLLLGTRDYYYICNPSTGKLLMLPPSKWCGNEISNSAEMHITYYIGYDHIDKKYKVLHLYEIGHFMRRRFYGSNKGFEVYTLGGFGWRAGYIEETTFDQIRYKIAEKTVCVHGAIHWIISSKNVLNLVAFDLQSEEFRLSQLPQALCDDYFKLHQEYYTEFEGRRPPKFYLGQTGGHLVVRYYHDKDDFMNFSLWVLEDYENKGWVDKKIQLSCRPTLSLRPISSTQTFEIILDPCSFPLDKNFKPSYLKETADGVVGVSDLPEWILIGEQWAVDGNYLCYPADHRVYVETYFVESIVHLEGALNEPILLSKPEEDAESDDDF